MATIKVKDLMGSERLINLDNVISVCKSGEFEIIFTFMDKHLTLRYATIRERDEVFRECQQSMDRGSFY